jgi:hypothetical protein
MLPVSSLIKVPVPYIWYKPQIRKLLFLLKLNLKSSTLKGKRQTLALRHYTAMMRCRRKSIGAYLLETSSREILVARS